MKNKFSIAILLIVAFLTCAIIVTYQKVNFNGFSKSQAIDNFNKNRTNFTKLFNYIKNNNIIDVQELEFGKNDMIKCYITHNVDSANFNSPIDLEVSNFLPQKLKNIYLLKDKRIVIETADTLINIKAWSWDFEGSPKMIGYDVVLNYLNMNEHRVDSLRYLTSNVDCHSIKIDSDGTILLRYRGLPMCQAQYIISENENPFGLNKQKLADGFYLNLYKDSLYCGNCIWLD